MSPSIEPVVLPVSSWGEFGLLVATKLRRRSFVLKCATCQAHGSRIEIRLVLPNQDQLTLHGRVVDCARDQEVGRTVWVTCLTLEQIADTELARWEQLAATRPRNATIGPMASPRMSSAPPVRTSRSTSLDPSLFEDVPRAKEPATLLSLDERLEHELAAARGAAARGDHASTIAALERAIQLCPRVPALEAKLYVARARQAADLGQPSLAESLIEHARALSPSCIKADDPLLGMLKPVAKSRNPFRFLRRT